MTSKFELSISTEYVPDWGIVEALRELFQNALDNQTVNPENKMGWKYNEGVIEVSNKTSKLSVESLLLGNGTKHNRTDTIGKHGEGYKIAFMVLLRNNKTITVENYGAGERWEVRLVKSRRYNGQLVPTVFIYKGAVWKKKPSSDLTIRVGGITIEEYEQLKLKNLHLRNKEPSNISYNSDGRVLLDEDEKGNIYVEGLYVSNIENLQYGYDFSSKIISLDRDRKLVDSFNVRWKSSELWCKVSDNNDDTLKMAVNLVNSNAPDTMFASSMSYYGKSLYNGVAAKFYEEHGDDAVPVTSNIEYETVKELHNSKPVIVSKHIADILQSSQVEEQQRAIKIVTVKDQLNAFIDKIADRLSEDELNEINELIEKVNN